MLLPILIRLACASMQAAQWQTSESDRTCEYTVELSGARSNTASPAIIYLKGLASERVGTESDESIIGSFRSDGFVIVTVDFKGHDRARVPFINRDLGKIRDDIRAGRFLAEHKLDPSKIYIVPEGCRLKRDVEFYRDGERSLAMDIIYPSKPKKLVGAIIEFSCDNQNRFGNTSLSICSDTILDSFATEGFAVAMADHPVAAPYKGLDAMPDSARKTKAAVRTLRAMRQDLNLNGRIVPVGFSRGSGMALLLVTTDGIPEFEGFGKNVTESSSVQGGVIMSGRFTYLDLLAGDKMLPRYALAWGEREEKTEIWRRHGALDYLSQPTIPLFLTINPSEGEDALHQMKVLRERLSKLGSPFAFKMDSEARGHKVTLDVEVLTQMRAYLTQRLDTVSAVEVGSQRHKIAVVDLMILKRQKLGAFQLAKELGADGLEVDMGGLGARETFDNQLTNAATRETFLNKAKELGLEIPSLGMTGFFAQSFATRPTAPRMIQDCVDTMTAMGVKVAFLPLGVTCDLEKNPELRPAIIERLRLVGEIANKAGVIIGVETTLSAADEVKLLEDVGSPAVKIYFNFSNPSKAGRDISTELRILGRDRICQIHATNEDGVWLENDEKINLPEIKRTLDEMGWNGWLVVERSRDANDPRNVKRNFSANVRHLKRVFQSQ